MGTPPHNGLIFSSIHMQTSAATKHSIQHTGWPCRHPHMIICIHLQDPQGPLQCQQLGLTELQTQLSPAAALSLHAAQCGSLSLCTSSCSALRLQLAFPEKLRLKRCVLSPLHAAWIEVARLANVGVNPGWYSAAAWQALRMVMHANACTIGSRLSPVLSDDKGATS